MASPPFSLSTAAPGDSDIVSQFPALDRSDKDVIQSWLLANHDDNGNHVVAIFPWQSSTPSTPGSSLTTLFVNASGRLQYVQSDGTVHNVGLEPGSISYLASTTIPPGYLVSDGSAVSRSTYADLFTAIGTVFGAGDGSTTFNLPDIGGRVIAGVDHAGTVIPGLPGTFAIFGGEQAHALTAAQIPTITSTNSGIAATWAVSGTFVNNSTATGGSAGIASSPGAPNVAITTASVFGTVTISSQGISTSNNTGSQTHNNLQPMIVLTALIKT